MPDSSNRPVSDWILLAVAFASAIVGAFILIATALGYGHADVRGVRLEGTLELIFLAGLGLAVCGAAVAAVGLVRRQPWAPWALAAVWPTFALVTLVLDRIAPAPGPGRPLSFYLIGMGLLPVGVTLLLGHMSSRRTQRSHRQHPRVRVRP